MSVTPVSVYQHEKINFQSKPKVSKEKAEDSISKKKAAGLVAAAAISTSIVAGMYVHKDLLRRYGARLNENESLKTLNKNLTENCVVLKEKNKELQKLFDNATKKLNDIFDGDISPKEFKDKIYTKLKEKISTGDYGYDISTPTVTGKTSVNTAEKKPYDLVMPSHVGTSNRVGMKDLNIPKIAQDGSFSFELPMSKDVKIGKMKSVDFKPEFNHTTSISEDYADSVQWNNDKIARDIIQNFYDGHGQTLDGVKLEFLPLGNNRYNVRIEGKSTYTPDKAVYIGESTKRNDSKAAGNYGEGLKMSVLKLLRDSGAEKVKIGSDNWKLDYSLTKGNLSDKRVLTYSLDKVEKFDGNYIEFETSDKDLLETLRKTLDRFYHSNNKDFECPQFENELLGLKMLPNQDRGGLYIAGQRFEFNDDFDGLKGVSLFIKEKLPKDILDPSRDRTSLDCSKLNKIAKWISNDNRMSKQDKVNFLKVLEDHWDVKNKSQNDFIDEFLDAFLNEESWNFSNKLNIKFPDKFVAYSNASADVVMDLKMKGYKVCKPKFSSIGMPTIRDLLGDARKHDVVLPNDIEKKKILIIKEALKKLSPALKGKHFTESELDTKIFMFDKNAPKERTLYSDTKAEAIIDNGVSKGFWIDKSYLENSDFTEILETALHELSHKVGGDESARFSYKLTDVNRDAIKQILNDSQVRTELIELKRIWNELSI